MDDTIGRELKKDDGAALINELIEEAIARFKTSCNSAMSCACCTEAR